MDPKRKKLFLSAIGTVVVLVAFFGLIFKACSEINGKNNLFYIGRDDTWYPLDLRGKEKNMQAFTDDLSLEIAKSQGFRVKMVEVGANALLDGLNVGTYDAVLTSLNKSPINESRYNFSDPFYLLGPVLVTRSNSSFSSLEDLRGKLVGVQAGALQSYNIPIPDDLVIISYDTSAKALDKLNSQSVDGVIVDVLKAYVFTEGYYAGRLRVASIPLTDKGLRVVTRKDKRGARLIEDFNEGLKTMKESGEYSELIRKWDLTDTLMIKRQDVQ